MTSVLIIDWLGRGGIAQTSESWALELRSAGVDVRVITRPGRELSTGIVRVTGPPERRNALWSHAALCRFAASEIRTSRPDVVVVQNYVIPLLEEQVHRAARRAGAKVVFVVHDHRHHEWREGGHLGLAGQLRLADELVVHSAAVGNALSRDATRVLPLPAQIGMLAHQGDSPVRHVGEHRLALSMGILNRGYKGTDTVVGMAAEGVAGWTFAFAGVGAPRCRAAQTVDRFLEPGELVAAVRTADAVVLPYRHATQSAAVVLAQLCGTVPVATAVDGLVEQIEDGVTGLLVPPGASPAEWRDRLELLNDVDRRNTIACQAEAAVWLEHEGFRRGIHELVGITTPEARSAEVP